MKWRMKIRKWIKCIECQTINHVSVFDSKRSQWVTNRIPNEPLSSRLNSQYDDWLTAKAFHFYSQYIPIYSPIYIAPIIPIHHPLTARGKSRIISRKWWTDRVKARPNLEQIRPGPGYKSPASRPSTIHSKKSAQTTKSSKKTLKSSQSRLKLKCGVWLVVCLAAVVLVYVLLCVCLYEHWSVRLVNP